MTIMNNSCFEDKRVYHPVRKLSNVILTALVGHNIVPRNYRAIISILLEVFTREDVFAGESRKFAKRKRHA